jgi:large subunit ribosomal protein L21e
MIQISMAVRIGGLKRKSRYKLKKERREKGKISVSRFMQSFKAGQKVHLSIEPALHKGTYHLRFMGKTGTIKGVKGKCYEVAINDNGKDKLLIIHPSNLKTIRS